jgi:hypothetical protein
MAKKERLGTKTTVSLAPLTVAQVLAAMLKTPPPPKDKPKKKGEALGGAVYEHGPEVLRNPEGFLAIGAALHAHGTIPVEDVDRERFWVFGGDEHATKRAGFPHGLMVVPAVGRRQREGDSTQELGNFPYWRINN